LELARVLVAADLPDAPLEVHLAGRPGHALYRSFHRAALDTIEENAHGLRRVPYARVVAARERLRRKVVQGAKTGVSDPAGSAGALMPAPARNPAPPRSEVAE
jgi:hypothetical protein